MFASYILSFFATLITLLQTIVAVKGCPSGYVGDYVCSLEKANNYFTHLEYQTKQIKGNLVL